MLTGTRFRQTATKPQQQPGVLSVLAGAGLGEALVLLKDEALELDHDVDDTAEKVGP